MFPGLADGWRRSRRALLFLVAIGLPCALLVGLSLRMLAQERELADKRVADERRRTVDDITRELTGRLERLRLVGLSAQRGGTPLSEIDRGALALVARIDGERLVLPWESGVQLADAVLREPAYADVIRAGERSELLLQQFDAAVEAYRRAAAAASPVQVAFAHLLEGRALSKAGRHAESTQVYRHMLGVPPTIVDDQGIPFAFYAARRLIDATGRNHADLDRVVEVLAGALEEPAGLAPVAAYMLDDLVADVPDAAGLTTATRSLAERGVRLKSDLEQALALQRSLPSLLPRPRSATAGGPVWIPVGDGSGLWLVHATTDPPPTLVAVRASAVVDGLASVGRLAESGVVRVRDITVNGAGEPLGPSLPSMGIIVEPSDPAVPGNMLSPQRSFYVAALALVMSMTLLGAYLLWRDVRREVRLAGMRSQFVSSVSHELKTPLTAIRMFADTLLGRSVTSDVRDQYLETIVNESERLTRLLNNVLDFSNIEQGRKGYRLEPQSLATITEAAVRAIQYPLRQQGFELRVSIGPTLPPLAADADAIQQAILNLLSNAMKFSGDSRVIELTVTQYDGHAVIAVADRGLGIPAGEQERIFEKFYRIPAPEYDRIPGTGLGLTLVEHVARAHGGRVTVRSAPGEGSTFSILLPLTPAAEAVAG